MYKKKSKEGEDKTTGVSQLQASLTVENLWQTLQDMLSDEFTGSTVYIAINNLHALSQDLGSTHKLLELLHAELEEIGRPGNKHCVPVKWFLTSRETTGAKKSLES